MQKLDGIKKFQFDLISLVESNTPIIQVVSKDFNNIHKAIKNILESFEFIELSYNIVDNLKEILSADLKIENTILFIDSYELFGQDSLQIFHLLKKFGAKKINDINFDLNVILYSEKYIKLPESLESLSYFLELKNPELNEIIDILENFILSIGFEQQDKNQIIEIAKLLIGLNRTEIELFVSRHYQLDGSINFDKNYLLIEKVKFLLQNSSPDCIKYLKNISNISFANIGGASHIREYIYMILDLNSKQQDKYNKLILIEGSEGSGKKSIIYAIANLIKLPLISIESSNIKSKDELYKILSLLKSIRVAILWIKIDFFNKQLFELFLRELRNLDSELISIVTETVKDLDSELDSNGFQCLKNIDFWLFDRVFRIYPPDKFERDEIFKIHLRKRGQFHQYINLSRVINESENLSGAEIELIIKNGIEKMLIDNRNQISEHDLLDSIKILRITRSKSEA